MGCSSHRGGFVVGLELEKDFSLHSAKEPGTESTLSPAAVRVAGSRSEFHRNFGQAGEVAVVEQADAYVEKAGQGETT